MITGGQQVNNPDQPATSRAVRQAARPRQPGQRPAALTRSAASTAAVAPAAMIFYVAPRWVGILAVLLLVLTSLLAGVVAAIIPQESDDRLSWWREWLRHRERMAAKKQTGPSAHRNSG